MNKLCFLFLVLFIPLFSVSQEYEFRHFTETEGLGNLYVYDIQEDRDGYMWLATAGGLYKFDGYNFNKFNKNQGLANSFITAVLIEDATVYVGHNNGGFSVGNLTGDFKHIEKTDNLVSGIVKIFSFKEHIFLVTENEGVQVFNPENDQLLRKGSLSRSHDLHTFSAFKKDNKLFLGGEKGIYTLDMEELLQGNYQIKKVQSFPSSVLAICAGNEGNLFVSVQDSGIVNFNPENYTSQLLIDTDDLGNVPAVHLSMDKSKGLWIATSGNGVFKVLPPYGNIEENNLFHYKDKYGLDKYCHLTYHDSNNHHWVSGFGSGVSYLVNDYLTFYKPLPDKYPNNIYTLNIEDGKIAVIADTFLIVSKLDWSNPQHFDLDPQILSEDVSKILFYKELILIATKSHGIYAFSEKTRETRKLMLGSSKMTNSVTDMVFDKGKLYLATFNGLVIYSFKTDSIIKEIGIKEGLDHNVITALYPDTLENKIWMGTKYGSLYFIDSSLQCKKYNPEVLKNDSYFSGITRNENGDLILATNGNGIIHIKSEDSTLFYNEENGLLSDYCYGLELLSGNKLVALHLNGITEIDLNTGQSFILNNDYGIKSEINRSASSVCELGNVWLGTDGYLIRFNANKYQPVKSLPKIDVYRLDIDNIKYDLSEDITLNYGKHKIEYYYQVINLTHEDNFKLHYRLEGLDSNWYEADLRNVLVFKNVNYGKYQLKIKIEDRVGNQKIYNHFKPISIAKPLWYRWWFYPIIIALIVLAVYVYIYIERRNHQKTEKYLYSEIEKQTKLIRWKNKNLTDSINYAKKIQDSLLPSTSKFKEFFEDFFILYKPKDIVGGDFYFLREKDNYCVLGVGDCTGHGVPGGFMTMLSINLLNSYVLRDRESRPDKVLSYLHGSIISLLHNNQNNDSVQDGLDLALCKIDFQNKKIYFCGARRSLILVRNGEFIIYKGSRKSLGELDNKKEFKLEEINYKKGDTIYMFTDGYVDQFDASGKQKLMMKRFYDKLANIQILPLKEQNKVMDEYIEGWKGAKAPQTDDILLGGFKLR